MDVAACVALLSGFSKAGGGLSGKAEGRWGWSRSLCGQGSGCHTCTSGFPDLLLCDGPAVPSRAALALLLVVEASRHRGVWEEVRVSRAACMCYELFCLR